MSFERPGVWAGTLASEVVRSRLRLAPLHKQMAILVDYGVPFVDIRRGTSST